MLHIDWTIHFWAFLGNLALLCTLGTFLAKLYRRVRELLKHAKQIIDEHNELWWHYQTGKPNGDARPLGRVGRRVE